MPSKETAEDVAAATKLLRPDQRICTRKLLALFNEQNHWSDDRSRRVIRQLQARGFVTRELRRHKDGAMITVHMPPLQTPQKLATRSTVSKSDANEPFNVERTFTLRGGSYKAGQLRALARQVLKELGEL